MYKKITHYITEEHFNHPGAVQIKGATDVRAGAPILTRLTQWKIVPKRAVDFAVDLQDGKAVSRSSVNNCTGGKSDPPELALSKPLPWHEKRELEGNPAQERSFLCGTSE